MADSLSTLLSTWRNGNQSNQGLLSKISIDGSLYDIKDPAVEYLAGQIETRLQAVETKTIRSSALTKANNEGKFATVVEQGTDGQISVTYSDFTGNSDAAVAHQFVTAAVQGTDGEVAVSRSAVKDTDVVLDTATVTALGLSGTPYVSDALSALHTADGTLLGASGDAASANTIYGAKAYADAAVAALAGQNWGENAKKVQEIIAELEDSENGNAWLTAIDKLAGLTIAGKTATAGDAIEYNEGLEGAVKAGAELTAAQASAVNSALSTSYAEGQTISASDAATYNATLTGHISQGDTFTDTNVTVKEYVDAKVAAAESAASGGITDLDAEVYAGSNGSTDASTASASYTADTTSKVAVKVTEVDGVITGVNVKVNDIASAADLTTLDGAVVKTVNTKGLDTNSNNVTLYGSDIAVSSSDATAVSTALSNLDTNKANKAAIVSSNINNWSTAYASETLTWTNTSTAVYVPVSGQSL